MEQEGARQFHMLKADLKRALLEAEAGEFVLFNPEAYEPDTDTKRPSGEDN